MSYAEYSQPLKTKPAPEMDDYYWVFFHEGLRKYVILHDGELGDTDSIRWDLDDEGFDLLWDSARSRRQAIRFMEHFYPQYSKFEPIPVPISFREACYFVNQNHRHHAAPQGTKFTVAVSNGRNIIGVLIAGRPVSRHRDDGLTLAPPYVHQAFTLWALVQVGVGTADRGSGMINILQDERSSGSCRFKPLEKIKI